METSLDLHTLLNITQCIERQLGRTQKTIHQSSSAIRLYSDRKIDIDLIRAFDEKGDEIFISSPELILPHPLWEQRDFVKVPLAQICQNL